MLSDSWQNFIDFSVLLHCMLPTGYSMYILQVQSTKGVWIAPAKADPGFKQSSVTFKFQHKPSGYTPFLGKFLLLKLTVKPIQITCMLWLQYTIMKNVVVNTVNNIFLAQIELCNQLAVENMTGEYVSIHPLSLLEKCYLKGPWLCKICSHHRA